MSTNLDLSFVRQLFQQQQGIEPVPSNQRILHWVQQLTCLLFPEKAECLPASEEELTQQLLTLRQELLELLLATQACRDCHAPQVANAFFSSLPDLCQSLNSDIDAILAGDPAARNRFEIIRAYPGFIAISYYRLAHRLHQLEVPLLPRIITELAHTQTGIDIHPGAQIGDHFFIDHGTGIVIGETTRIGSHVKLYQGVTLGALSVDKAMANTQRHPTVEDHVVIYSGATILGGQTVIGHHSIIGGNVWLTKSVPPYSKVYHKPEITVETASSSELTEGR